MDITGFSVKNYAFTIIIFVMMLFLGINALLNMPRGEDPPFGAPIFVVFAIYPGTSPADLEQLIADPIEESLYNLEDIKKIISFCDDGILAMRVEFNYGVDVDAKNNDVIREVNRIRPDLPADLKILRVERAASSDVTVMQNALVSETATVRDLNDAAEDLKKSLERIKDLKWVKIQANPTEEITIQIQLERMAQYRLGLDQVLGAIQTANVNIPGGSIDIGNKKYNINTNSDIASIEEISLIIVRTTPEGNIVYLKDIATILMENSKPDHIARLNGKHAIWVNAALKDGVNIIQTRSQIEEVLTTFKNNLQKDISLINAFDQTESVKRRLSGLGRDFLIAVLLVLLTLLPLGFRASLVVMISIPLSLSMGLVLLDLLGFTLNQLSIVGLVVSLGLLVDDSIVIVENIERFLRMGYDRKEAAITATRQISLAVIGCTATLLLAFLPLTFLPEGSGEFIRSMPMAVLLTVFASLFVSLTIIPFLSRWILKPHEQYQGNFFFRLFKKYVNRPYQSVLAWAFRHPILTLTGTLVIFVSSLFIIPAIGFSLFPISDKPMFSVEVELPPGANITATDAFIRNIEDIVIKNEAVISVNTNVGKGNPRVYYNELQKDITPNYAQLLVMVSPEMKVPEITAVCDSLRMEFEKIPGAKIEVRQFAQGPPVTAPVEFRILGSNLDTLAALAGKVEMLMRQVPGTIYIRNDVRLPKTDLRIVINKEKAGLYGILPSEVAKTVRLGITGLQVTNIRNEEGDEYAVNVKVAGSNPPDIAKVLNSLYVTSLSGSLIPLAQIATLEPARSPTVIRHYNKERFTIVTSFAATGYNTLALIEEMEKKLESLPLPQGYKIVAGGEKESREESFGGMSSILLIALFGLMAILVLEFRTFKSTMIVLSVVPLGIIGALVALAVMGETLSFVAAIGMVALVGIEIKNSILLVDYTNQLREGGMDLLEAVLDGAETRFLPILLTSLTAIGGLIPLALERSPLISPLAFVLIGGLISSTLLSRIVTPLLYWLLPPQVTVQEKKDTVD